MFVLFVSLILSLENTRIDIQSVIVFILFLLLAYIGFRRSFVLEEDYLVIHSPLFWRDQQVKFSEIRQIVVGPKGLKLDFHGTKSNEPQIYLMRIKSKTAFVDALKTVDLPCEIEFDDTIKMTKE